MYSHLKIDTVERNLTFNRNVYELSYTFKYHEGCDRMVIEKRDGTEEYVFDIFNHRQTPDEIIIDWSLTRKITRNGITQVSNLDPEVWEFIEGGAGDDGDGPMFANSITGGWATVDSKTGKVKLISKGHSPNFDPIKETRRVMRSKLYNSAKNKREPLQNKSKITDSEIKARETLRDLISERDWERYLSQGFVIIKGNSGKVYQIFSNHQNNRIRVYEQGKHLYNLCIHSEDVPDTDHVLSCMLLIQNDENEFFKMCNRHETHEDIFGEWEDTRYKGLSLHEILLKNHAISKKLKIPKDWIDVSVEREEKAKAAVNAFMNSLLKKEPVTPKLPD